MVDTVAEINKSLAWTSTGTSDKLIFNILPPQGTKGAQLGCNNIDLNTLTVTVIARGGASKVATFDSDVGRFARIAEDGFDIASVVISNVPAGTNVFSLFAY